MAIKTPKKIRKAFDIKGGLTPKDVQGVIIGIGAGFILSLSMITPLRLVWLVLVSFLSIWLMMPNKAIQLKHWQVVYLLVRRPIHIYIAERDSRNEEK